MDLLSASGWLPAVDRSEETGIATHHSLGDLTADSSFSVLVFPLALSFEFISFDSGFSFFSQEPHRSAAGLHPSTAFLFMI